MRRLELRKTTVLMTVLLAACGSSGTSTSKTVGAQGGPCTTGGGCDPGLVCHAQLCVLPATLPPDAAPPSGNCSTTPLGGMRIPTGTVATANASYSNQLPSNAIDGSLTTVWNSGSSSGWLRLDFPAPVAITGVHLAAGASPTTSETYTITTGDSTTPIGSDTRTVTSGPAAGVVLEPIPVTPGTYSSLTITIKGGASWVQLQDVALVTASCPVECGCETRLCGDDGCGNDCGTCLTGETCIAGDCVS